MAKTTRPLHSLAASGTFAGEINFRRGRDSTLIRRKHSPAQPRSAAQQLQRARMQAANAIAAWLNLTAMVQTTQTATDKTRLQSQTAAGTTWNARLQSMLADPTANRFHSYRTTYATLTAPQIALWEETGAALTPPLPQLTLSIAPGAAADSLSPGALLYLMTATLAALDIGQLDADAPPYYDQVAAPTTPFIATGGDITTAGAYTIHTFTASGTFTVTQGTTLADVMIQAGGAGGQTGTAIQGSGGGGAGGNLYTTDLLLDQPAYTVTIGAGGDPGTNGNASAFSDLIVPGGGKGGWYHSVPTPASNGGCGGGGATDGVQSPATPGLGSHGFDGGTSCTPLGQGGWVSGGGGGGIGANGTNGTGTNAPGNVLPPGDGGAGLSFDISGTDTWYGGGGGGTGLTAGPTFAYGAGGQGGGGSGSNGTANTGGGASAGPYTGGSGIVIIRYLTQ